jgi:hypothetical protein
MTAIISGALAWARRFGWSHPEWWTACGAWLAWVPLVAHGLAAGRHAHCAGTSLGQEWTRWMLMVAAMMVPLNLHSVRQAAFRSLRGRRHRAVGVFLLGYLAPWAALGLAEALASRLPLPRGLAGVAGFVAAAVWMTTPVYARAVVACHRIVPLAPRGWRADADCLRFGASVGGACLLACWASMTACALSGHSLPAMLGGAAIGAIERTSFRLRARRTAVAMLGLAIAVGALGAA